MANLLRDNKTRFKQTYWEKTLAVGIPTLYLGLQCGNILYFAPENEKNIIAQFDNIIPHIKSYLLLERPAYGSVSFFEWLLPVDWGTVFLFLLVALVANLYFYQEYLRDYNTMIGEDKGTAKVNTDLARFYKLYLFDPATLDCAKERNSEGRVIAKKKDLYTGKQRWWQKLFAFIVMHIPFLRKYFITKEEIERCKEAAQIYSKDIYISLNNKYTGISLNTLYLGTTGTGKSRFAVKPNILQANSSFVVTDPSAEIYRDTAYFLEEIKGYDVKILNLKDMSRSTRYNPFAYCDKTVDITIMMDAIKKNIEGEKKTGGENGSFWDATSLGLLTACGALLCEMYDEDEKYISEEAVANLRDAHGNAIKPLKDSTEKYINPYWKGHRNFTNVMNLIRMVEIDENGDDVCSMLDEVMSMWEIENPKSYAVKQYRTALKMAPGKTGLNILVSTANILGRFFDLPEFINLTYVDEMDIRSIGRKKTAVFLILPEGDKTFNFIAAMFYSQLFTTLYREGEENAKRNNSPDPELEVPVRVYLDEMANVGTIPDFNTKLSTMRKYRISCCPIFQSLSQCKTYFGKDWETMAENCTTTVFLGGSGSTAEWLSKRMGKMTLAGRSNNYGRGGSTTRNSEGRNLFDPNELENLPKNKQVVYVLNEDPFITDKFPFEKHPNYQYTSGANKEFYRNEDRYHIPYNDDDIDSAMIYAPGDEHFFFPTYRGDAYKGKEKKHSANSLAASIARARENAENRGEFMPTGEAGSKPNQEVSLNSQNKTLKLDGKLVDAETGEILSSLGDSPETVVSSIQSVRDYCPDYEFTSGDFKLENASFDLDDFDEESFEVSSELEEVNTEAELEKLIEAFDETEPNEDVAIEDYGAEMDDVLMMNFEEDDEGFSDDSFKDFFDSDENL